MSIGEVGTVKSILFALSIALIVWALYPSRQLAELPEDGVVEIIYMGPTGPIKDAQEDAVREFERRSRAAHAADPSKPIYRVVSSQNAAKDQVSDPTRFLVSIAGGMPPDVIMFDRFAIAEWAARGAFDELDPYMQRDIEAGIADATRRERFFASAWDEGMYQGKTYGIPASIDNRALIYNADLFVRAGIVDEHGNARPPRTWEDLAAAVPKLTQRDSSGRLISAAIIPEYPQGWLYLWSWANGGEFLAPDGKTITMNSPAVVEALAFMKQLADLQGGYQQLANFKSTFLADAQDPFFYGKLAMKIDGVWSLAGLSQFAPNLNFAAVPMPRPARVLAETGNQPVSFSGGWGYCIPRNARNKQAAWEFIRFLTGDHAQALQMESDRARMEAQGIRYMPIQQPLIDLNQWAFKRYVTDNPQMTQRFKDALRVTNDLIPFSRFRPSTPVGQLLWNEQVRAQEAALYGALSPQQALDRAATTAQHALDRVLAPPAGIPVRSWNWFFALYAALLIFFAVAALALHLRKHPSGKLTRRLWPGGVLCASPWLVGFIVFGGGPMLFSLFISFCDYDILHAPRITGLDNYRRMLTSEPLLPVALWNTAYMFIAVPLTMAVSLAIALLLNTSIRLMPMWRTFFYLPAIVPAVAMSLLWVWLLNPQNGLINLFLGLFGIQGPSWLQSADWSKPGIIIMKIWAAGGGMIIWLAGLKSIPPSLYEAAEVDGASPWQQFWAITIPQLTPYIFFNLIMGLIGTFQIFTEAFVMTQGGPVNSTLFYVYHLFNHAFRYGNMGYASAMAWMLFAIVLVLTIMQLRLARRWVHYEAD